jgi:hypothetical protein
MCNSWLTIKIYVVIWKKSLNNDGQQFHRYQQTEQSPQKNYQKAYFAVEIGEGHF